MTFLHRGDGQSTLLAPFGRLLAALLTPSLCASVRALVFDTLCAVPTVLIMSERQINGTYYVTLCKLSTRSQTDITVSTDRHPVKQQ